MESNLRTLSGNEARVVLSLVERDQDQVTTRDVYDLLGEGSVARKVVHNLVRKGWLTRLARGRYLLLPPEHGPENFGENNAIALASAIVRDAYVAWWSAASFHGFTPQVPMMLRMASLKAHTHGLVEGTEVRFVKVPRHKFFGFKPYDVYGRQAVVSDPAKTLVDCVDRPSMAGGAVEVARIVHRALDDLDADQVLHYAMRMKSKSLIQRLGFLADEVGKPFPETVRGKMASHVDGNLRSVYGRPERRPSDIGFVKEWGLLVNLSERELLSDLPFRRRPDA